MKQTFSPAFGGTKSISVTTTTSSAAIESSECDTVLLTNLGDDIIYVRLGDSSVEATSADLPILGASAQTINRSHNHTHIAAIADSETATLKVTPGYGV